MQILTRPQKNAGLLDPSSVTRHRVIEILQETNCLRTYTLAAERPLGFECGQAVLVDFQGRQSPLMLSSAPSDGPNFQLSVSRKGAFGRAFYEEIKVGSELSITRPFGSSVLSPDDPRPLCVIARDHSVVAARSLFLELLLSGKTRRFTLLHEVTDPHQLAFDQEFRDYYLPGFCRYLFLAEEREQAGWPGPLARISGQSIAEHVPELESTSFYLCCENSELDYFLTQLADLPIRPRNLVVEGW